MRSRVTPRPQPSSTDGSKAEKHTAVLATSSVCQICFLNMFHGGVIRVLNQSPINNNRLQKSEGKMEFVWMLTCLS